MMNRASSKTALNVLVLLLGLLCLLITITVCSKKGTEPPPSSEAPNALILDSLSAESGWPGDVLSLFGNGFGDEPDSTKQVVIGDSNATNQAWSESCIMIVVPDCPGITSVSLVVGADTSSALPFQVNGILGVRLEMGGSRDTALISGLGFGDDQDSSVVELGGQVADITSWSDTLIGAMLPDGMDSSCVKIVIDGHTDTWEGFGFRNTPLIEWIKPTLATYGTELTIWGERFLTGSPDVMSVYIGDGEVPWHDWSENEIVATVPSGCTSGDVRVCKDGYYWSNEIPIVVFAIISVEPQSVLRGDTVRIIGSGFGDNQGTGLVLLNGFPMPVISWFDGTILIRISEDATSGLLLVQVEGTQSNSAGLTVRLSDPPVIERIEPTLCTFGDEFTIWGDEFHSDMLDSCFVYINDIEARWEEWNDNLIIARVPFGSVSGDVRVCRDGEYWSDGVPISVFGITSVEPGTAYSGDTISVNGTGFGSVQGSNAVLLDGTSVPILSWSSEEIKIILPADSESGQISVENEGMLSNEVDLWVIDDYTGLLDLLNLTNFLWFEFRARALYSNGGTATVNLRFSTGPLADRTYGHLVWDNGIFTASGGKARSVYPSIAEIEFGGEVDAVSLAIVGADCTCSYWYDDWMPGAPAVNEYAWEYQFTVEALPLAEMRFEDTLGIHFESTGPEVADAIRDLSVAHYRRSCANDWDGWECNEGWIYVEEVLWDDPEVIPHLSVTFEQR